MKILSCALSDVGKKRKHNEDSILANEDLNLFMVADGMGGHSGGEFASRLAVQTIQEVMENLTADPEATVISGVNTDDASVIDRVRYAIEVASQRIFERAQYDPGLKGMGTTTVMVLFDSGRALVANVGDSRAYYFKGNNMEQVTTDHSLVNEQIKAGLITESDAKSHKLKNIITRSVGYQDHVEIDIREIPVERGDKILLCSDGLSNMVSDSKIKELVLGNTIEDACKLLIETANANGGEDNVSVLLTVVTEPN